MPGPDPHGLWVESDEPPFRVTFQAYFWTGNNGNRQKRAAAMLGRLARGTWKCEWCREPLPDWRRVDAQYCREGCRKKAARWHRKWRGAA